MARKAKTAISTKRDGRRLVWRVRLLVPVRIVGIALALALTACGDSPRETGGEMRADSVDRAGERLRYRREFVFVGSPEEEPLVAPFSFRAIAAGDMLERQAIAWLARGPTWDRFLDDTVRISTNSDIWRVVPQAELVINAGGPVELESFRYERGERRMRLDFTPPVSPWNLGGDTRFRIIDGRLMVGSETISGSIFEVLQVERTLPDGWPPGIDFDAIFLTSGDSIQLVLAKSVGGDPADEYAWLLTPSTESTASALRIDWLDMRPLEEARRDVPGRWSFVVPELDLEGEVEAVGYDLELGPERAGRRTLELRYTVTGAYRIGEQERRVVGMIRHTQQ